MSQSKETKFEESEFFFDDCEICRAMAKAEKEGRNLGFEELKDVFDKTNNNSVGN